MNIRFRELWSKRLRFPEKKCSWFTRRIVDVKHADTYKKRTYGRIARLNLDVRAGSSAACRTLISDVVVCSHSECVEWASENGCRDRGRHFGVWKKMVARGSELHERGRFTIREISFLWGLGFLGNPITGVKCDLGSWPYTACTGLAIGLAWPWCTP